MLAAIAVMVPIEGITAAPAGAAGGTRCGAITGTAHFQPALPVLSKKKKVVSTVSSVATLKRCQGGGVESGTVVVSYKLTGNCTTLHTYRATPTTLRITIAWNTNQTSSASIQVHSVKAGPAKYTVTGEITSGPFDGLHLSTAFTFAVVTKGGCLVRSLKEISVSGGPLVIK